MWRQTALGRFKDYSLNKKKQIKKRKQNKTAFRTGIRRTGGCNKLLGSFLMRIKMIKAITPVF